MTTTSDTQLQWIPLDAIQPSRHQARKAFNEEGLKGLAESMKQEGLIQPVVVRQSSVNSEQSSAKDPKLNSGLLTLNSYELISGERRLRAAKMLGWATIEAKVISTVSEGEAAAKGLVENLQREDLNSIEEAEGFAELSQLDPVYWTQTKIAQVTGKDQTYISRSLALLKLPEEIKIMLRSIIISRNHGIQLCRLPTSELQINVAKQIPDRLTVVETRQLIDSLLLGGKNKAKQSSQTMPDQAVGERSADETHPQDPCRRFWDLMGRTVDYAQGVAWKVNYDGKSKWAFEVTISNLTDPETGFMRWFGNLYRAFKGDPLLIWEEKGKPKPAGQVEILPVITKTKLVAPKKVYFEWKEVPGAKEYKIYYSLEEKPDVMKPMESTMLVDTFYTLGTDRPFAAHLWLAIQAIFPDGVGTRTEPLRVALEEK